MLQKLIHRLLEHRHPWRDMGFSELSELYTSMMFRSLALSLVGIFIPIFLYKEGVALSSIFLFFATLYGIRMFWDVLCGFIVARLGPKHSMALSYIPHAIALSMLATFGSINWPLWTIATLLAISTGLFFVSYNVDFSKIKHSKHGGKEIGFMLIMEKFGSMLGPITGGLIALTVGVKYSFAAAGVFFIVGMIPLFMTKEPVKTRQVINFADFPINKIKRDLISYGMLAVENNVCVVIWPLSVAIFILTGNVYFKVGLLASIGVVVSIISARTIGKLIDDRQGRTLLRYSLVVNTVVHLIRPVVQTFSQVFYLNLVNEFVTPGYRMPWTKGWYDKTDDFPGHRIVYVSVMESSNSILRAAFYTILAFLTLSLSDKNVFVVAFILGAIASWLISLERFPALNTRSRSSK